MDNLAVMEYAEEAAMARGFAKGELQKKAKEVVQKPLAKGMAIQEITELTGLSLGEFKKL